MFRVFDLILNPWHFARLYKSALPPCSLILDTKLTYMPTINPINTVFKQAISAVILFLNVGHSRAIGWR